MNWVVVLGVPAGILWLAYTTWDSIREDRKRRKPPSH